MARRISGLAPSHITIKQAAHLVGVHRNSVRERIERGKLVTVHFAGELMAPLEDVRAWMREREATAIAALAKVQERLVS